MMKKINKNKKDQLKWKTVDQVFKNISKKTVFQNAYRIETERIKIARDLRDARLEKNLTQAMVAKRANMPQSVIARLESGNHGASVDTLNRVANAVGKRLKLA